MRLSYIFSAVMAGGLFVCSLPSPGADSHDKDRRFIGDAIRKTDQAFENKNADGYVAFTADDFVNIEQYGRETTHGKQERHDKAVKLFSRLTDATEQTTVNSITFSKDGATVAETSDGTDHLLVNGKPITLVHHATYRDFWVRSGIGWVEKRSRTVTSQKTVNGQPVP